MDVQLSGFLTDLFCESKPLLVMKPRGLNAPGVSASGPRVKFFAFQAIPKFRVCSIEGDSMTPTRMYGAKSSIPEHAEMNQLPIRCLSPRDPFRAKVGIIRGNAD